MGGDESDIAAPAGLGVCYRNSRTRIADVVDGTSRTILVGEHAWANAKGIWAGAISGGVCQRGEQNSCPGNSAAWYPAPALVQTHGHLNNATTDTDGGLDDFSRNTSAAPTFYSSMDRCIFCEAFPETRRTGITRPKAWFFRRSAPETPGRPYPAAGSTSDHIAGVSRAI